MTTYEHAKHLYSLGMSLIPVNPDTKIPAVRWKLYQTERCTPADLRQWFQWSGFAIGIVTGELSGIVAIDCDDLDAIDTLLDYTCSGDVIEESLCRQHTKRGMHFIYRHPGTDTRNTVRLLGAKIDRRADGGYIRAYADSQRWTVGDLATAPVYQDVPRESMVVCE